jgi:hypothetical protein
LPPKSHGLSIADIPREPVGSAITTRIRLQSSSAASLN